MQHLQWHAFKSRADTQTVWKWLHRASWGKWLECVCGECYLSRPGIIWFELSSRTKRASKPAILSAFPDVCQEGREWSGAWRLSAVKHTNEETDSLLLHYNLCYKLGKSSQQKVISTVSRLYSSFYYIKYFCFIPCGSHLSTQTLGFYNMKCYSGNFKESWTNYYFFVICIFYNLEEIIRSVKYFKSMFCPTTENEALFYGK